MKHQITCMAQAYIRQLTAASIMPNSDKSKHKKSNGLKPHVCRSTNAPDLLFKIDPPPFGVGSTRFNKHDTGLTGQGSPGYHAAYKELNPPPKRNTKGWTGMDDGVKQGRGTSTGKVFSSMAPPSAPPASGSTLQPMLATYPNETRLQELLDLQKRKTQGVPSPGSYEVPTSLPSRITFRRPARKDLDGPFLPQGESTRVKEMEQNWKPKHVMDLGPGQYEAHVSKEATSALRPPRVHSISKGPREGRCKHTQSLSISRSLQHGIDWHVPVIIQAQPPPPQLSTGPGSPHQQEGNQINRDDDSACQDNEPSQPHMDSQHAEPRYMQQCSALANQAVQGIPPVAPPHVAKTIKKAHKKLPGNWDWDHLSYNYRTNWTSMHGGAYSQGDKPVAKQAASAPHMAGNAASLHLQDVPITYTAIFPIAEEASMAYRNIHQGESATPQQAGTTQHITADLVIAPDKDVQGLECESPVSTCRQHSRGLASAQDYKRHTQARQAADAVQAVTARKSDWEARSGGNPSR